jgi:cilia- and flagella-associated protein 57
VHVPTQQIKARDDTIGEKEKRIYELKKKNQELEKFKFVLDYKIKELKRQIEPRETEISAMKDQIKVCMFDMMLVRCVPRQLREL